MNTQTDRAPSPDERRVDVATKLARYPNLPDNEVEDLRHWFHKEATALETAMLASDEQLREPYQQFRNDHLDRLSPRDKAIAWAGGALVLAGIAAMAVML